MTAQPDRLPGQRGTMLAVILVAQLVLAMLPGLGVGWFVVIPVVMVVSSPAIARWVVRRRIATTGPAGR